LKKNAYVLCTGCPESRIDSARVQNFLKENGWNITNNLREADIILFRACGLKEDAVQDALQITRGIKAEKKADAQFIVWGCLPKIDPEALKKVYNGVTFGEKEINILDKIIEAKKPIEEVVANYVMPTLQPNRPGFYGTLRKIGLWAEKRSSEVQSKSIFHIKVSTGCLGNCSFCAIRKSRGVIRSKSIDCILSEFRHGLHTGARYFTLLATDLGDYGRDIGHNLVNLLAEMTKEKGNYKIGLRNVNPYGFNEMLDGLKPIFSSGRIWFLSSPAESGSNRILKLMNRRYKIEDFKRCIQVLNKEYPRIFLRTQLMVGFPTETQQDFEQSIRLLEELKFDWVEVYKYSPRPGTPAATMKEQIPENIKETRLRQLTLKAMMQRPHKKVSHLIQSYLKSYCERQDWIPPT
jgi:MiaB/RimO family radical SAM methylthiotransferase